MINRIIFKITMLFCCIKLYFNKQNKQKQEHQLKLLKQNAENIIAIERLLAIKKRAKKEYKSL